MIEHIDTRYRLHRLFREDLNNMTGIADRSCTSLTSISPLSIHYKSIFTLLSNDVGISGLEVVYKM